ncbi:hypothetical protein CALVIDRAFT_134683 [Calocera viscosa TUFC12733]|uniref:Uncharacterized protein n=1 Tax=Calocera viscosa (strain TUFC12733) TaxID=1330018 RepID=A0A167LXX2_CALVF|nr:hypothetical protein CALVIDRAFT_134683 [Calocera viscosa TUFC12733]
MDNVTDNSSNGGMSSGGIVGLFAGKSYRPSHALSLTTAGSHAGVSLVVIFLIALLVAATYVLVMRRHPPGAGVVWLPASLARRLGAGVTRAPEPDAAELPSYAEAALSPVPTIIEMGVRTPFLQSRGSSIPPPYDPSTHSLDRAGAEDVPLPIPARPRLRSRPSSTRVPTAEYPPAGTPLPPAEQPSGAGRRSRPPSRLRLASLPRGLSLTAIPSTDQERSSMTRERPGDADNTRPLPGGEHTTESSSVSATRGRSSGAGVRSRLGGSSRTALPAGLTPATPPA